ncbi:hypothetical protein [Prosthecobacter sp.]|uniref:hypothetical protein n=1 Tax=Prosthecobacter sp. TaxID=1965333 RepID=UPI0037851DBA
MPDASTPAQRSEVMSFIRSRTRRRLMGAALLIAVLGAVAGGVWYARQPRPLVITLDLQYSSPLSRQYFGMLVLYVESPAQGTCVEPPPTLSEPTRKVWTLDPAAHAGTVLDLRDPLGVLKPWKREVLFTEFDTFVRKGRKAHLTIGGNTLRTSFRVGGRKLGEPDYWRYTLTDGDARLLEPEPGGAGTSGKRWRLVQRTLLKKDCTCQFALISPGNYRVELLNSAAEVILAGPLHVPGDSAEVQLIEAEVARP